MYYTQDREKRKRAESGKLPSMEILRTKRVPGRRQGDDVLRDIEILQQTLNDLRGCGLIPKGVYRFRSHEEADAWMIRTIAANHARHSSRTS